MQGRHDEPLSPAGRALVQGWRLPAETAAWRCITSPLARARETAALLGFPAAVSDPRLIEMDWGAWEGQSLAALRAADPAAMAQQEAKGLDLLPPGGESPRHVQARLRPWLQEMGAQNSSAVVVCHKGVLRALFCLASGWDMRGKAPQRLTFDTAHLYEVDRGGQPQVLDLRVPLVPGGKG